MSMVEKIAITTNEIDTDFEVAIGYGLDWGIQHYELKVMYGKRVPDQTDEENEIVLRGIRENHLNIVAISPGIFMVPLDDKEKIEDKLSWIAFKQHFFSAALTSSQPLNNTELNVAFDSNDGVIKHYKASADLDFSAQKDNHYTFNFFFGPNQYKILKAHGDDFEKIIKNSKRNRSNLSFHPCR